MKKRNIIALILMAAIMLTGNLFAQDAAEATTADNAAAVENTEQPSAEKAELEIEETNEMSGMEELARNIVGSGLVDLFIQGGFTMWPILALFIWGIATIIWKLVALSMAKKGLNKILDVIVPLVEEGKYKEAEEECDRIGGPVASVLKVGLQKADMGVEAVEKAIESAGVIEMAFLEKGFVALSSSIALAPMFGFFGTLVGMIEAFEAIAKAGEVDPTIVADGMKIALITSAAGLAVAIPVQFFNNIFMTMVDGIVLDMQRGSEKVVETLIAKKHGA
ncbi:MAG: biopolymer transporter ExbB [Candidatus Cloacimonadota bacterium]|nr:MAG: biopolymer transporter ExbB [Candidatus Cloacimonadota bacterium]